MKVLIIRSYPTWLNVENSTYNIQEIGLAKALVRKGLSCDVLFWTNSEEKSIKIKQGEETITVFYKRGISILKNGYFTGCSELFDSYDILQVSEYNQIQSWALAKKYPHKAVVYHGPYYSNFNWKYNLMAYMFDLFFLKTYKKNQTLFLTKSQLAEDYLRKKGLEKIHTIGVGLDTEAFNYTTKEENSFFSEIELRPEEKILYVGKIEPRRNVFFLVDMLKEMRVRQKIILIVVGTGNQKYVHSFFEYAKKKEVHDSILYCSKVDQKLLPSLYSFAKVFLFPTLYDIFGMVILEAMYFKKCVFTTQNGGSSMAIQNEENGFVIDGFDEKMWADKVLKVLNDKKTSIQVGEKAYRTVESSFTWDALSDKFIDAYRYIDNSNVGE